MASLSIRNLKKIFGKQEVLKDINIEVEDGEFLVLVGPSGCGKSTLLNMIAGLETISSGEMLIGERLVNKVQPKDRDIAMVFQSYALYPNMTVRKNISFGLEILKLPKQEREEIIKRVAKMLQIEELLDRKPSQLSGGQRQRVAMGRALSRDPAIFLFDEPLSNLDAKLRVDMRTEIKLLHQQLGTTIVYVTHDQIEAMTLAQRIAVMKDGILQQIDTPQQIYDNPANLFVAGFMGSPSMNFIPSQLVSENDQLGIRLTANSGETRELPVPANGVNLNDWIGKEVILGVRPEQLQAAGKDDTTTIPCKVNIIEPTGPDTLLVTVLNDKKTVCRVHPLEAKAPGEIIELAVDLSKAVFFDPETENRIR
jgi:multiple sugar transport system ATP-binding protein